MLKRFVLAAVYILAGPFVAIGLKLFTRSSHLEDSHWIPVGSRASDDVDSKSLR